MNEHTVISGERTYKVVLDRASTFRALVAGRAQDELTGRPALAPARVSAALRGISPDTPGEGRRFAVRSAGGGTFAVAGTPDGAFPDLALTPHTVDLVVGAAGYLDTPVEVAVAQGTTAFPVSAGTVALRRDAVMLQGRVTSGVPPAAVAGAQVQVVAPLGLVGLQASLAFAHGVATAVVPTPLAPAGVQLALREDVQAGATSVPLARRDGLAPGSILRFGTGDVREFAVVTTLDGPTGLSRPGIARLRAPLRFGHRVGEGPARRVVAGAPGPPATLSAGAFGGDRVAFVDDPTLLPDLGPVLFDDPDPARREYIVVRRAEAQTAPDGYYRIAAIGRAAAVTVHVIPPAGPVPPDVTHIVSYGARENVLDLRI